MRKLLDTHTVLWWAESPAMLPTLARNLISAPGNIVTASIASYWEISNKVAINKRHIRTDIVTLESLANADLIVTLPVNIQAINFLLQLPHHHKDPFDRLLAATALTTGDTLVSADPVFDAYGVTRLWS